MSDIALQLIDNCFDVEIKDNDLTSDDGLETALAISLFTDKRVTDEELPSGHRSKRGWWGDMFPDVDQDQIGSRLWTLDPEKTTTETLRRSEDFARECTNWMIEDGLADAINVLSEYNINKHLILNVDVVKPDGITSRFAVVWDAQEIKRR
jgi:phage gp46-like protein